MTSELSQREKRETFRQDLSLRKQSAQSEASTFSTFAQSEMEQTRSRFNAEQEQIVVGRDPIPKYPALSSGPWSGQDPVPDEEPLGYSVDEMSRSRPEQGPLSSARSATGEGAPAKPPVVAAPSSSSPSPQRFQDRPPSRDNIATHSVLGAGGDKLHRRI
jgi:hypothetical protein